MNCSNCNDKYDGTSPWRAIPDGVLCNECTPEPMVIHCPQCLAKHVDSGAAVYMPHSEHTCTACGNVFSKFGIGTADDKLPKYTYGVDAHVLPALTLWPEWCPLFFMDKGTGYGPKDIENRPWKAPKLSNHTWVAIHAGKSIGGRSGRTAHSNGISTIIDMMHRAGFSKSDAHFAISSIVTSAIVGVVRFDRMRIDEKSPWAIPGQYHWHVAEARKLTSPVAVAKGALGLWHVEKSVAFDVGNQVGLSLPW